MKVHLLFQNKDYDPKNEISPQEQAVCEDLELDTLVSAMSGDDEFLATTIRPLLYCSLLHEEEILYRQEILRDSLTHASLVQELYSLAVAGWENKAAQDYMIFGHSPTMLLERAVLELEGELPILASLRDLAEKSLPVMKTPGWQTFFQMLQQELTREYLQGLQKLLQELHFPQGLLVRVHPGIKLTAEAHTVCQIPDTPSEGWFKKLRKRFRPTKRFSIVLAERDESGHQILSEMLNTAVAGTAATVAACQEHVRAFFASLRTELAFYLGCLRLAKRLNEKGIALSFPILDPAVNFSCQELSNITLALRMTTSPVTNTINAETYPLVMITGANQGGKTTFLRSLGQARIMMGCGMFVAAAYFRGEIGRIFTHFRREEDQQMKSGKFDEELQRMNDLIDCLHAGDLLLLNESSAATNEREGSAIALEILQALYSCGIKVAFVTHFYALAHTLQQSEQPILFLRAGCRPDGKRTFAMETGKAMRTSFGMHIYHNVFGNATD